MQCNNAALLVMTCSYTTRSQISTASLASPPHVKTRARAVAFHSPPCCLPQPSFRSREDLPCCPCSSSRSARQTPNICEERHHTTQNLRHALLKQTRARAYKPLSDNTKLNRHRPGICIRILGALPLAMSPVSPVALCFRAQWWHGAYSVPGLKPMFYLSERKITCCIYGPCCRKICTFRAWPDSHWYWFSSSRIDTFANAVGES